MAWHLYRLGRWSFRRRGTVLIAWVLLLVFAGTGAATLAGHHRRRRSPRAAGAMGEPMIPVLMADDETLIRTALATMLGPRGPSSTSWSTSIPVDIAIELLELTPGAAVLIVTSHGRPAHLKRALAAGIRGFRTSLR